jgi:aminoglycoside N3'-acetyltransferase
MNTKNDLIVELKNLGLNSGDLVMLHASMRAIGKTLGGPDQIHQAVIDIIGSNGTLMMYVGCESKYESVGRGKLSKQEEKLLLEQCPAFDAKTARARRDYGILCAKSYLLDAKQLVDFADLQFVEEAKRC